MSKIKEGNYVLIQSFMITDLKLKGNELLIYAIIYGFSQTDNQVFSGGLQYLCEWTNSTKQGVLKNLKSLMEKGFIRKTERVEKGVKFVDYWSTELNGVVNKVEWGGKQSLPNNINNNIEDKEKYIINNIPKENFITQEGNFDYQKIVDMWNNTCLALPKVKLLTETRKRQIRASNKKIEGNWQDFFDTINASDFLCGRKTKWKASFDWCLKSSNLVKILEGNYNNKGNSYMNDLKEWANGE